MAANEYVFKPIADAVALPLVVTIFPFVEEPSPPSSTEMLMGGVLPLAVASTSAIRKNDHVGVIFRSRGGEKLILNLSLPTGVIEPPFVTICGNPVTYVVPVVSNTLKFFRTSVPAETFRKGLLKEIVNSDSFGSPVTV